MNKNKVFFDGAMTGEKKKVSLEELKESEAPIRVAEFTPYKPGTLLEHGFPTKSGAAL